ncbi:PAS domain-containing sensor histidine kinase [Flagellimonas pacifica]|uniref:histidine kinase n=1 Tax=Flagellimonas pacifica TaxID=1247520 RepID=A0A285MUA0_9FLAO|nr:PAS domain-containing sensor histidine kinase [Allomuricauda parva]SNZ00745.1 PAS domain S-box-containing protein [Allomuricauda parva]
MQVFEKNSEMFTLLSEGVSEGIIVVNEKQIIVATNSAANEMFGYDMDELINQPLNTLIPVKFHHGHGGHFKNFLQRGEKRKMAEGRELFGLRKNGEEFPIEAGLNPFHLQGATYIMALIMDVSVRKAIEKDLNLRSKALSSAINGITITDAKQKDNPVIYLNAAFENLTGYPKEEILNKNLRFLQRQDNDQQGVKDLHKAVRDGKSCEVEIRNYKKDGTLWWNKISITPIKDSNDEVTHFVGIQNNVTDRIEAEEERNHWNRIFEESLNEIYIIDAKTLKFLRTNQGAQNNLGYNWDELQKFTPVDIKPEYNEVTFKKLILPLRSGKEEKITFETVHLRKDGSTYPVEVHLQSSYIEHQKVLVAIVLDITDRKDYTEKLERTVEERTQQLRQALEKEKELNELKTRFLSLVSHEFKTPLSSILTSTTLLSKYTESEQQPKRDKHITTVRNKVKQLDNILNDFLSIERLETGKVKYNLEQFPLSKVVNQVIYDANLLLKSGQKINYPEGIDDVVITFDEKIFELVLSNLVHNAIKYSPENTTINLEVLKNNGSLQLMVKDQGIGIPETEQKFIFNRYFRANNALLNQGTGIGLNIVKQHLENMGGNISFTSQENTGSTFIVEIPTNLEEPKDR